MRNDFDGVRERAALESASERHEPSEGWPKTERLALGATRELALVDDAGRTYRLEVRALAIGRGSQCDIQLFDRSVSGVHARVVETDDGWEIRDQGSTNGTWVDSIRVTTARLRPGVEIVVGRSTLRCVARKVDESAPREGPTSEALYGRSVAMSRLRRETASAAITPYPVLVHGESGTGKELVARAVHQLRMKPRAPFVAINAGALPETLVEDELFGHEKGAFTGANARRRGAFEQADGGVLFLDEVGELPLAQQAKLLRVLETWEVRRVGAESPIRVHVKLVCATHRDLFALVREGRFREDLLFRIAQHTLRVAPLRERIEDLPSLARSLCERVAGELGRDVVLEDEALAKLLAYEWPGNVRELLGVLRAAASRAPDVRVGPEHLGDFAQRPRGNERQTEPPPPAIEPVESVVIPRAQSVNLPSGEALLALLDSVGGSLSRLARLTGKSRAALRERVKKARAQSR
ncbi:MAG: sigma 54-interacting transcriptional regulator [Myxococcales bacterium]|nr:sigma 54-interacting transcriptional regulator [Myxococcales bacterium]